MLAPMTVKNIPITMMIVAQPMTWIVAIARSEMLGRISSLPLEALSRPYRVGHTSSRTNPGMTPYGQRCVEIRTVWTRSSRSVNFYLDATLTEATQANEAIGLLGGCSRHDPNCRSSRQSEDF